MAQTSRLRLLEEFLDQLAHQRRLSAGTALNYRRAVEELFDLNDGVSLKRLQARHMRSTVSQLHSRGISGRTIATMLSGWRGFFNWLVKPRGFPHNPCAGLRAPKSPKALPKALSPDLMARLLEAPTDGSAQSRDKAMFELLYSSGLRLAELVSLDAMDGEGMLRRAGGTPAGQGGEKRTPPGGRKSRTPNPAPAAQAGQLPAAGGKAPFLGGRGPGHSPPPGR